MACLKKKGKNLTTIFLHTVVDLSLRRVLAPDGTCVLICQVDANVPILLWCQEPSEGDGKDYSLGKALDINDKLLLEIRPFDLIIKRCADSICFCVIAPNDVEESIYSIKRFEKGEVTSTRTPDGTIGKVSKGARYEFDLQICSITQSFRIETVPSEDCILGKSKIIWQ